MSKYLLSLLLLLISISAKPQTNQTEAKAAYLLAEESYGKGDYKSALRYLETAKQSLGASNSKMLYLQIQTEMEIGKTSPGNSEKLLALIAEFEKSPGIETFNEEKVLEVAKAKLMLKSMLAEQKDESEKAMEEKLKYEKSLDDKKKRGQALGGIIVYEKDGHGLILAETDLRKGNAAQAFAFCQRLVVNGFEDWYLPSMEELKLIYLCLHKNGLGGLKTDDAYWSSKPGFMRWGFYFANGSEAKLGSAFKFYIRPVRKF